METFSDWVDFIWSDPGARLNELSCERQPVAFFMYNNILKRDWEQVHGITPLSWILMSYCDSLKRKKMGCRGVIFRSIYLITNNIINLSILFLSSMSLSLLLSSAHLFHSGNEL